RAGDLSALTRTVVNPATHLPYPGNQIPSAQIDPAAARLLALMPLPNQAGSTQNFHTVSTTTNQLDDINLRIIHNFGQQTRQQGRGARGGGGGGGGRGGRGGGSNLNISVHYRHSTNSNTNPFPALGGSTRGNSCDVPVGYSV